MTTRKAFTLVEIMIVVLIIGVLLAVAVPNFSRARAESQRQSCVANLARLDSAKEQWALQNNRGPGAAVDWGDIVPDFITLQPRCQMGGTYELEPVGTNPTCTVAGHVLVAP